MSEIKFFQDAVDAVLADAKAIMIERQRKYGPGNISADGPMGVIRRLEDKLTRLKRFYGMDAASRYETLWDFARAVAEGREVPPPAESVDESLRDTRLDGLNYFLILEMLDRGLWGLPLKGEDSDGR